ncbi:MAG: hypothetical protein IH943_07135 [Acidobacteria bacterium]|nr:hypothetical protein [Acidobacteriota bacterium]
MKSATLNVEAAARLCGVSRGLAYEQIRRTGELAGVRVLHIGHRLLIPAAPLRSVLGLDEESDDGPE